MHQTRILANGKFNRRGGVGLLFIVFLLVMGFLIWVLVKYAQNADSSFSPWKQGVYDRYVEPNAKPWEEDKLIWGKADGYDANPRRPPFSGQPVVKNRVSYEVNIMYADRPMGTVAIGILSDFDAIATWKGEFNYNGKHYTVDQWPDPFTKKSMNYFNGNINPLKIYVGVNGKDRKKLYFITRGYYEARSKDPNDTKSGTAYVTGWISKDFSAEGTLSIPQFDKEQDLIIKWGPVAGQGN